MYISEVLKSRLLQTAVHVLRLKLSMTRSSDCTTQQIAEAALHEPTRRALASARPDGLSVTGGTDGPTRLVGPGTYGPSGRLVYRVLNRQTRVRGSTVGCVSWTENFLEFRVRTDISFNSLFQDRKMPNSRVSQDSTNALPFRCNTGTYSFFATPLAILTQNVASCYRVTSECAKT